MPKTSLERLSLQRRLAGAAIALVCSLSILSSVFVAFAAASGELDPLLASLKPAAAASAVAGKAPAKRERS